MTERRINKECPMRKVIVGAMVSMDGVMQAPGGPEEDPTGGFKFGGWVAPLELDAFDENRVARNADVASAVS
jgi:hypothetical protein